MEILTSKTLSQLETENTTGDNIISLEADIIVGYTKNRSQLENNLINLRNNKTYTIWVETGFIIFRSYPHELASRCLPSSIKQTSESCTISQSYRTVEFPYKLKQVTVNKLLNVSCRNFPVITKFLWKNYVQRVFLFILIQIHEVWLHARVMYCYLITRQ